MTAASTTPTPTEECLDEETILSFCRGGVAVERRPAIEKHIGECDECRALVSAVARSSLVDAKELIGDPAIAPTTPAPGIGSGGSSGSLGPLSSPVHPGDLLAGKYLVERVLGAGGMGVVVAARHTQLDQRVALKFLLPAACEAPGAIPRFLREGKAAASIASEHVARVVDTGVLDNGSPYLVMEYLDGADLAAITTERGSLPPHEAIDFVLQACEAIVEAHQLGIVHRDLKPANLFLTRRKDGSPLVKVLDFGISKSDGGSRSQLTSTSALMGSPRYMSPEQMVSARDVDARTDVWALGVILYELTTGRPVWHADTVQGLCAMIASAPAPLLRQRAPHAPVILEEVVLHCLAKSPNDRIASVADLALALEPIAPEVSRMSIERILKVAGRSRQPTTARSLPPVTATSAPPPPASSAVSTKSKTPFVALVGALIGVLVLAGVVLNVVAHRPKTDQRDQPAAEQPLATNAIASASASASASSIIFVEATSAPTTSAIASTTTKHHFATGKPRASASASTASSSTVRPETPAPTQAPDRALTDRK